MKHTLSIDYAGASDRLARIEEMMTRYRRARQRRLVKRAMAMWRKAEMREQSFVDFRKPRARVH